MTPRDAQPTTWEDDWTFGWVAKIVGGDVASDVPDALDRAFGSVATDSRSIAAGEVFLALRGERFDGHRFCDDAARRGVAGLVVERDYEPTASTRRLPTLRVRDTLRAYGDLAAGRRAQWGGPVLALSGSAGKTTTRRMLAAALGRHRRVLEPVGNYNNLIGVPHTLMRLEPDHDVAVLELGMNQPGELRRLSEIAAPTCALLTHIGLSHVGMFASEAELVEAKLDLFAACAEGTPLVVNAACARTMGAVERFVPRHPIVRFGVETPEAEVCASGLDPLESPEPMGWRFDLTWPGGAARGVEVHGFGRSQVANATAAAAMLHAAGFDPMWVAEAMDDFRGEPLRGECVSARGATLIVDCYNAAPGAMRVALETLAEMPPPQGRCVLVLADMLELGDHARRLHEALLEPLRRLRPDRLLTLGPEMARLSARLADEGLDARAFETRDDLAADLTGDLCPGDRILFKGAHAFALERVAQALAPETHLAKEPDSC